MCPNIEIMLYYMNQDFIANIGILLAFHTPKNEDGHLLSSFYTDRLPVADLRASQL